MSDMNPELKEMLTRFESSPEVARAKASDDQKRTEIIDKISRFDAIDFIAMVNRINDMATAALGAKSDAEWMVCELAMIGWTVALESLQQRLRDQEEA